MSSANGSSLSLWQRSKSTVLVVVVLAIGGSGVQHHRLRAQATTGKTAAGGTAGRGGARHPGQFTALLVIRREVRAAEQVALAAQVSARVVRLPGPGGAGGADWPKGTLLAQLEKADFEFALQQQQAALAQAEAQLQIEQGQAALAQEEYAIAAQPLSEQERALVLREPQIASPGPGGGDRPRQCAAGAAESGPYRNTHAFRWPDSGPAYQHRQPGGQQHAVV